MEPVLAAASRHDSSPPIVHRNWCALAGPLFDPYIREIHTFRISTAVDIRFGRGVRAVVMGETTVKGPGFEPTPTAENDPLDAVETRLVSGWIRPAVGEVAVLFGPLETEPLLEGTAGIHLTLLGISPATQARVLSRQPQSLLMFARYLVTVRAPTRAEADRLIVALGFAALDRGSPELERDGAGSDLWLALRVAARPALVVREALERPRVKKRVPLVRRPVETEYAPGRRVAGRIVGPGNIPIAGARIEVASAGLTTYSDHRGDFILAGVPTGPPDPTLFIAAKGVRLTVQADASSKEPLLISVPLPES
jgi:hypothetical protein